ncbi:hypothetical protein F5B20DRAFT_584297 [Whalleya microplaca]|nr:hypothetical protein F5B20DRAFT_584297 [Whalleya microplaca]
MAITESLPGVSVTIRSRDAAYKEYEDPDPLRHFLGASKFIEATDGGQFSVGIEVNNNFQGPANQGICLDIYVDGQYISSRVVCHGCLINGRYATEVQGRTVSVFPTYTLERPLHFVPVLPVRNAGAEQIAIDQERVKRLGVIQVQVFRCVTNTHQAMPPAMHPAGHPAGHPVGHPARPVVGALAPEAGGPLASLRNGLAPRFGLFAKESLEESNLSHRLLNQTAAGLFQFYYRSRTVLQDQEVIPRDPVPHPQLRNPIPALASLSQAERDQLAQERLDQIRIQRVQLNQWFRSLLGNPQ